MLGLPTEVVQGEEVEGSTKQEGEEGEGAVHKVDGVVFVQGGVVKVLLRDLRQV